MATKKAKASNGALVQLKDQSGSFVDPVTGFSLTRDEVKEWPANPGDLAMQFKQLGHIIEATGDVTETEPE